MDRKIQYCQDVSPSELNLQIQSIPNQNPPNYFVNVDKLILKLIWRTKDSEEPNTILKAKNKGGGPNTTLLQD
jgi:hypothetical protein